MTRALCPGSFDPLHLGHVDVITRAARLFDEVVVAVSTNPAKTYRFDAGERRMLCEEALAHLPNVTVVPMGGGLLADFCREQGAVGVVKGLRSGLDVDYELPMARMNRHLAGIETVFLPGNPAYLHVSSTLVKEVAGLGGDVELFVPPAVLRRLAPSDGPDGTGGGASDGPRT